MNTPTLLTPLGMLTEDGALVAITAGEFDACDIINTAAFDEHERREFAFALVGGADIYDVWQTKRFPGHNHCYQCDALVAWLAGDSRCKDCTRLTPEEVAGSYI